MKVKVHIPTMPKDAEVSVQGLGVLQNGHSYDFDTEHTQLYCTLNNVSKPPAELVIGQQPKAKTTDHPVAEGNKTAPAGDKKEGD